MPRTKQISEKNTKQEIMDAYREIVSQVSIDTVDLSTEDKKALESANKESVEKITNDLSSLKLSLNKTLTELTDRLTHEAERLTTLRRAITISQKELDETEKIKVQLGMLKRLLELHVQKENELAQEIESKRKEWETEQAEYVATLKRERTRADEEYAYARKLEKKQDEDERIQRRLTWETELQKDKEKLSQEKRELEELRKKTAQYPDEIDKVARDAASKAATETKKEADIKIQMLTQEHASQIKLERLKIEQLESLAKSQTTEIERLKKELTEATRQVKDIAVAVIEGPKKEISQSNPQSTSSSK